MTGAVDLLIGKNLGLAYMVANRIARQRCMSHEEREEVVSDALVGLVDAARKFDPNRGLKPSTYLTPRIRGAILDGLRSRDRIGRDLRSVYRALGVVEVSLTQRLGRTPSDREIAAKLGVAVSDVWDVRRRVQAAASCSLDETLPSDEHGLADVVPGSDGRADVERWALRSELVSAMDRLNEQERIVVWAYHFDDRKLREIASEMGVTESRVSQIRTKALAKMRAYLEAA